MTTEDKVIMASSILYTIEDENLTFAVAKELEVKDPENGKEAIEKNLQNPEGND